MAENIALYQEGERYLHERFIQVLKIEHMPLDKHATVNGHMNNEMPIGGVFKIDISPSGQWRWHGKLITDVEKNCFKVLDTR